MQDILDLAQGKVLYKTADGSPLGVGEFIHRTHPVEIAFRVPEELKAILFPVIQQTSEIDLEELQ